MPQDKWLWFLELQRTLELSAAAHSLPLDTVKTIMISTLRAAVKEADRWTKRADDVKHIPDRLHEGTVYLTYGDDKLKGERNE